jgi:hypothetical protein
MVPVFLLVVGICLPLVVVLSLYYVPVIAQVSLGRTPGSGHVLVQASWGWIGARRREEGGESRQEFLLRDRPLYTKTEIAREARLKEELRKIPSLIQKVIQKEPYLVQLIGPFLDLGGKILDRMTLEEIRGRVTVGLRNPAETGILYGCCYAFLPVLMDSRASLEVTPVFDRQVLEGEIMAKVRIDRPLLLMFDMVKLFLDRDVRNALLGLWRD